jgi:hypothetical protein
VLVDGLVLRLLQVLQLVNACIAMVWFGRTKKATGASRYAGGGYSGAFAKEEGQQDGEEKSRCSTSAFLKDLVKGIRLVGALEAHVEDVVDTIKGDLQASISGSTQASPHPAHALPPPPPSTFPRCLFPPPI